MEPTDITVQILQDIRSDLRTSNEKHVATQNQMRVFQEMSEQRFEVIETTLRDMAQQLVMLSRGMKTTLEDRSRINDQIDDHEKRLRALEQHPHN